ncbi:MAG: MerR family transcriptional regulator [Chloroflexi bacterium]|nr:MerR family transcriptional regulator [Chloroflexota bacterium]
MNIGEAADASSLTPDTIRFYEKKGILPRPPRLASGYRHYTEEHVATLRLAKALRELESPLAEVAPILSVALAFGMHATSRTRRATALTPLQWSHNRCSPALLGSLPRLSSAVRTPPQSFAAPPLRLPCRSQVAGQRPCG